MSAVATMAPPGSRPVPAPDRALFVIPRERDEGFQASINGHILALADPGTAFAPAPDDLFVASLASELAWSMRRLLRSYGIDDAVSVCATWTAAGGDIELTVSVSRRAAQLATALAAALGDGVAARALRAPFVHISFEGVNR